MWALDLLLGTLPSRPRRQDLRLLLLDRSTRPMGGLLHAHFRFVVSVEAGARLLPAAELVEVLSADNRADLFIGGEVIRARPEILLYRGNLEPLAVPLRWFNSQPGESAPDPTEFAVTDYGQTVRLGTAIGSEVKCTPEDVADCEPPHAEMRRVRRRTQWP
jgi:hypothetical protein